MLSLIQLNWLTKGIRFGLYLLIWTVIFLFIYHVYLTYENNAVIFQHLFDLSYIEKSSNSKAIIELFLKIAIMGGWTILKMIFIGIVIYLFNRIPLPSKIFGSWLDKAQISPILGRFFTGHFRTNRYMNIMEFNNLYYWSTVENYHLQLHKENPYLNKLFYQFDSDYHKDIENK